jgi:hypothetical protein
MKHYPSILVLIAFFLIGSACKAQIALAFARDEKNRDIMLDYHVEWNFSSEIQAGMHAGKYLENKGYAYKNVYSQPCGSCGLSLEKGYYVVIKATYTVDKSPHVSFGIGANTESYEQAELRAIDHLCISDIFYDRSKGYQVVERGIFSRGPVKQLIYIIKSRKTPCGESSYDFSYMLGTYPNTVYVKIYNGFKKQNSSENPVIGKVGHIVKNSGYIGILKCNQKCQDGSVKSIFQVMEAESVEEIKIVAPYDKTTISPVGQSNYFVYYILDMRKDKDSSIIREDYEFLQNLLGIENKAILDDWASSGIRD